MTLDEAIAKAKKALERQNLSERGRENISQFAAWLEELKQYREEKIQETNLDHFRHKIIEEGMWNLAVVKGNPKLCECTVCGDCEFNKYEPKDCVKKAMDWLKQPYKSPANKLTKFEFDLLQSYLKGRLSEFTFKSVLTLNVMKEKGYFKDVDENATIEDILANCEITEED